MPRWNAITEFFVLAAVVLSFLAAVSDDFERATFFIAYACFFLLTKD